MSTLHHLLHLSRVSRSVLSHYLNVIRCSNRHETYTGLHGVNLIKYGNDVTYKALRFHGHCHQLSGESLHQKILSFATTLSQS